MEGQNVGWVDGWRNGWIGGGMIEGGVSDKGWMNGSMMDGWNAQKFSVSLISPFLDTSPQKKHDAVHYFVHRHHILDRAAALNKQKTNN